MHHNKREKLDTLRTEIRSQSPQMGPWVTFKSVFAYHWHWYAARKYTLLAVTAFACILSIFIIRPFEAGFNDGLRALLPPEQWTATAQWLSWGGEYAFPLLLLFGSLLLSKCLRLRRLQLVTYCLLAAFLFSTLVTRTGKIAFGRIRPIHAENIQVPDHFTGPNLNPKYHSFPSGHTSASFAVATPVFSFHPLVGAPALLGASAISLSRAHLNQHYPSDLLMGFTIGLLAALPSASLLRRKIARP